MQHTTAPYTEHVMLSKPGAGTGETVEYYERRWPDGRREMWVREIDALSRDGRPKYDRYVYEVRPPPYAASSSTTITIPLRDGWIGGNSIVIRGESARTGSFLEDAAKELAKAPCKVCKDKRYTLVPGRGGRQERQPCRHCGVDLRVNNRRARRARGE